MNNIKKYNQSIKDEIENELLESKKSWKAIENTVNPIFKKAIDDLLNLNFDNLKSEMIKELIESCNQWISDEDYNNTPMDALLFEYYDYYSNDITALAYGIIGDLESENYDYDFANGIESHEGITLRPCFVLKPIDENFMVLVDEDGFNEMISIVDNYIYLVVHESFEAFVSSKIFEKISRKPIFYLTLGEHDMGNRPLYYVCDDELLFESYLKQKREEVEAIELEEKRKEHYKNLKYTVDEQLDNLVFEKDTSNVNSIIEDLKELIDKSEDYSIWARNKLGSLYFSGIGIRQDYNAAHLCFEAVIKGDREYQKKYAFQMLAVIYYQGLGVKKDLLLAHDFIIKAKKIDTLNGRFLMLKKQIESEM